MKDINDLAEYIWSSLEEQIPEDEFFKENVEDYTKSKLEKEFIKNRKDIVEEIVKNPIIEQLIGTLLTYREVHPRMILQEIAQSITVEFETVNIPVELKTSYKSRKNIKNKFIGDKFDEEIIEYDEVLQEWTYSFTDTLEKIFAVGIDIDIEEFFPNMPAEKSRFNLKRTVSHKELRKKLHKITEGLIYNVFISLNNEYAEMEVYTLINVIAHFDIDTVQQRFMELLAGFDPEYGVIEEELVWVSKDGQFEAYKLINKTALMIEGMMLGHCVGSYHKDVEEGLIDIYSIRTKSGKRKFTIEYESGKRKVQQARGKSNRLPGFDDYIGSGKFKPTEVKLVNNFIFEYLKIRQVPRERPGKWNLVNDLRVPFQYLELRIKNGDIMSPELWSAWISFFRNKDCAISFAEYWINSGSTSSPKENPASEGFTNLEQEYHRQLISEAFGLDET